MINWTLHYSPAQHLTHSTSIVSAFRGGIALAPNKQGLSNPIQGIPLPHELLFNTIEPMVKTGDTVLAGQHIASDTLASTSGHISNVQKNDHHITIKLIPDGSNTLTPAITNATNPLAAIEAAGLAGLGGAGFSVLTKLRSQQQTQLTTLVINAAECEPMIACDEALMREHAFEVVSGIDVLMRITSCKRCIFAIEDNKPDALKAIKHAIANHGNPDLHLVVVPSRYPGGAETVLLRQVTGVQITKDQRPADHGLLCFNVATAYSVHHAVSGQPVFGRVVSIAGNAANKPCNVQALFGTTLAYLLEQTNNAPSIDSPIKIGGPLSGKSFNNSISDLSSLSVTANCNAIIINGAANAIAEQACIRCGDCANVCPESLQPQQLLRYQHDYDKLNDYHLTRCIECRCCDLVCPSDIPLTDYFRQSKQALHTQEQLQIDAQLAESRFAAREQRLARKAGERAQDLLDKKRKAASASTPAVMDIKAALARAKSTVGKPSGDSS